MVATPPRERERESSPDVLTLPSSGPAQLLPHTSSKAAHPRGQSRGSPSSSWSIFPYNRIGVLCHGRYYYRVGRVVRGSLLHSSCRSAPSKRCWPLRGGRTLEYPGQIGTSYSLHIERNALLTYKDSKLCCRNHK